MAFVALAVAEAFEGGSRSPPTSVQPLPRHST